MNLDGTFKFISMTIIIKIRMELDSDYIQTEYPFKLSSVYHVSKW